MEVVNTFFPPVAAEYCWGVINLHSLAQDKEPINWKELLKDEDRGAVTEQQLLGLDSTNAPARRRPKFFFVFFFPSWSFTIFHDRFKFGAGEDECSPVYSAHLGFELSVQLFSRDNTTCWGRHLSVRADCWICLLSLVSWSASGGSWWGKHLRRWMRSWPSRCTSPSSPYSCRERERDRIAPVSSTYRWDKQRGRVAASHLMGTSLYWGWPGWVLPSSGVWVTVGMDLFTNTCLFSTLSPVPHTRHMAHVHHGVNNNLH